MAERERKVKDVRVKVQNGAFITRFCFTFFKKCHVVLEFSAWVPLLIWAHDFMSACGKCHL